MIAYTSLSPSRIDRQMECIESWRNLGLEVIAIQTLQEATTIQRLFPNVYIVPSVYINNKWSKSTPRLDGFLHNIYQTSIIINSDIKLTYTKQQFNTYWIEPPPEKVLCAIRYDISLDGEENYPSFNPFGIDVFRLSSDQAYEVPFTELAIGMPGWDYYLPWFLNKQFPLTTYLHTQVEHVTHGGRWNNQDQRYAWHLLHRYSRLEPAKFSRWIQTTTNRVGWTLQSSFDRTKEILNGSPAVLHQSENSVVVLTQ